ncbi:replication-associated recombination protein A [Fuerstiella marisgermanici]|uniref:Replication-associated recombination protein A n=1 Tax=Fuerstiella marisgermanici TaxID=1891926 RepID=A0A1P8WSC4_9PLAN|nr:replication-associated recombination protein A [Fuerstiella marisgermanici]APZ96953.1 Replication-associated recombination protein A [Fuerstiella marisgermanici]
MNLFAAEEEQNREQARPLAARMRPRTLDEFAGQQHILGEGKLLRRMLDADRIGSVIFYGPPGIGKTSLAELIAKHTKRRFRRLNATMAGVKDVRELLAEAENSLAADGTQTVVFIDELHRFSRSQQDILLPDVESGTISLIGATTANPFFSLVAPLISRSQIFEFKELDTTELLQLLNTALNDPDRGLGNTGVTADEDALELIATLSDGDARRSLMALEIAALSVAATTKKVDRAVAVESLQKRVIRFDPNGDDHYDVASAFIKSIRGSDPDASLYWLARMLESGEDPRFIARRLVIAASEDVGNADPQALLIATAAFQATETIGMPECRINLSQATTYLACAPKSNAAYKAIDAALHDVRNQTVLPVPMHLRDGHYKGAEKLGHGKGYKYAHDSEDGWVAQDYLGVEKQYYEPVARGHEVQFLDWVNHLRQQRAADSEQ